LIEKLKNAQNPHEKNIQASFDALQAYLVNSLDGAFLWDTNIKQLFESIASSKSETLWYRDVLFKYFLTMEQLQENMKEYQELTRLAGLAITEMCDS